MRRRIPTTNGAGEGGYILLAVLFLVMMVLITLSLAAPKMAADIERDREVELVHRGQQYVRAIKLYYKKFGSYPPSIDALVKTNEIRFLRKRYKDPMTGKDDWHLIHFGENKTPSYGFFGQPLGGTGGSPVAGVGPGSAGALQQSNFGSGGAAGGSTFGNTFGGNTFGGNTFGNSGPGNAIDSSSGSSGSDPNAVSSGTAGTSGSGSGTGTGSGTDPNSSSGTGSTGFGSGSASSAGSGSAFGSNGQTFGGAGIIGVESTNPKLGTLIWKKKTHFNEWEFWYDPNADRIMVGSSSLGTLATPGATGNGTVLGPGGINSTGSAPQSQFGPQTPATQSPSQTQSTPQ